MRNSEEIDFTQLDPKFEEVVDNPLREDVTDKDKFVLAKNILITCLCLFTVVMFLFAWSDHFKIKGPMKEVWDFSSQGLFGIVNLIIGFYFGGKIAGKS